ncbi:MAG: hypothetical protein ACRDRS_21230 [Pseudonocardiaceae bacterium]
MGVNHDHRCGELRPVDDPGELSTTLHRVRSDVGLPGMEAARRAGYSQPSHGRG